MRLGILLDVTSAGAASLGLGGAAITFTWCDSYSSGYCWVLLTSASAASLGGGWCCPPNCVPRQELATAGLERLVATTLCNICNSHPKLFPV